MKVAIQFETKKVYGLVNLNMYLRYIMEKYLASVVYSYCIPKRSIKRLDTPDLDEHYNKILQVSNETKKYCHHRNSV